MLIPGKSVDNSIRSQIGSSAQICADSILDTHICVDSSDNICADPMLIFVLIRQMIMLGLCQIGQDARISLIYDGPYTAIVVIMDCFMMIS